MLKVRYPLPEANFRQAYGRANSLASGYDGDRSSTGEPSRSPGYRPYPGHGPWRRTPPPHHGGHHLSSAPPFYGNSWDPPPPPWHAGPGPAHGHGPGPGPPPHGPWQHHWRAPRHHGPGKGPPGPPPIYLINTGQNGAQASVQQLNSLDALSLTDAGRLNLPHHVSCSSCSNYIFGVRWVCANCPTVPTTDLVSWSFCLGAQHQADD